MKKIVVLAVAAMVMFSGVSFAQGHKKNQKKAPLTVEQMAERRTNRLKKHLQLNDKQAALVYEIELTRIKENRELTQELKESKQKANKKMREVLTEEQMKQFRALNQKAKTAPEK